MQLSSEIINNYLKTLFLYTIRGPINSELFYSRPVFLDASVTVQNRGIYLCTSRELTDCYQSPVHALAFVAGQPREGAERLCDTLFVFEEGFPLTRLSNALNELFNTYDQWDQALSTLLSENSPMGRLLDCSEKIFENPILVHNHDFEFIAYSRYIDTHPSLSFLVDQDRSVEAYNDFRLSQDFQATFASTKACFFPDTITGIRSLYMNIFNHKSFIGRIVIPEVTRSFNESDRALLAHFSRYIQASIINHPDSYLDRLNTLDHLTYLILTGKIKEDAYIEKAMGAFCWQNYHDYFCTVFSMDPLDVQNHTFKMIRNRLEMLVPDSCIVEYQERLVMFVNLTLNQYRQSEIVGLYAELVRDSYLKAGYSKVYKGFHFSFRLLYLQANTSLEYGSRYFPDQWIHSFNSIADKYLLEKLTSDFPAEMVCAPEVVAMYHYDEVHHTEYFDTLKCYLQNNMQPVITAKKLFIHRTTLMYRLNKIFELFQLDLSTSYSRIFLQLSIMLLEQTFLNGEDKP